MHNACAAFPAMLAQPSHPSFAPEPPSCMNKDHPTSQLYVHQQRTVEVIQLIEVPPPPPRSRTLTRADRPLSASASDSNAHPAAAASFYSAPAHPHGGGRLSDVGTRLSGWFSHTFSTSSTRPTMV